VDQDQRSATRTDAPAPDDDRKPDSPGELHERSWRLVARNALREFSEDQCTDIAAALTYYAVLALFPAMLALVSILGLVGQAGAVVDTVLGIVRDVAPGSAADTLEPVLRGLTDAPAAGLALVTGLAGALWSASGYVAAFGRAMNRVYEIDEGRPFVKLRATTLLLTVVSVVVVAVVLVALVVSGPVAEAVGEAIGLGGTAVTIWSIAKWPVLVAVVVVLVGLLYYATPNVRQPKFKWVTVGAVFALVVWAVASALFGLYVANFSSYDATYGSLAGVVVFLLWVWITNLALLLGAEIDSELERARELQAGMAAERELQLPPRDTRASDKRAAKERADIERAREIRHMHRQDDQQDDQQDDGRQGGQVDLRGDRHDAGRRRGDS
jgi:membrane protein